jgi:hypothetical protein
MWAALHDRSSLPPCKLLIVYQNLGCGVNARMDNNGQLTCLGTETRSSAQEAVLKFGPTSSMDTALLKLACEYHVTEKPSDSSFPSTLLYKDEHNAGMVLLAIFLAASALSVNAQSTTSPPPSAPTIGNSPLPLTEYTFTYPNLVRLHPPPCTSPPCRRAEEDFQPEQVNPFSSGRGPQYGYNICNSSTVRSFTLWAPKEMTPDSNHQYLYIRKGRNHYARPCSSMILQVRRLYVTVVK